MARRKNPDEVEELEQEVTELRQWQREVVGLARAGSEVDDPDGLRNILADIYDASIDEDEPDWSELTGDSDEED